MKNLNLNKYGVQEMNAEEMRKENGGSLLGDYALGKAIDYAIEGWWSLCKSAASTCSRLGSYAETAAVQYN